MDSDGMAKAALARGVDGRMLGPKTAFAEFTLSTEEMTGCVVTVRIEAADMVITEFFRG